MVSYAAFETRLFGIDVHYYNYWYYRRTMQPSVVEITLEQLGNQHQTCERKLIRIFSSPRIPGYLIFDLHVAIQIARAINCWLR
jgi:hypothetical protein